MTESLTMRLNVTDVLGSIGPHHVLLNNDLMGLGTEVDVHSPVFSSISIIRTLCSFLLIEEGSLDIPWIRSIVSITGLASINKVQT